VEPTRALVVSDDPVARTGLAALLATAPEVRVVGPVAAAEVPRAADRADVVLWDVAGGDASRLRELPAPLPVVAVAATEDEAAAAVAAGAAGVVFRDAPGERLAAALVAAARGLVALDGALARWVRAPAPAPEAAALTARELEVLALLAEGLPNKVIAARLGVAERTARFHVESILGKLGAESRSEAIVLAARRGLVVL
jgi:DNA-binding NarL/FixJ family response regulator